MSVPQTIENAPPAARDILIPGRAGLFEAIRRGLRGRCPRCGKSLIFMSYIKVRPSCLSCGMDFSAYPTDDIPAYFTILIVGHIVVGMLLLTEEFAHPALWIQWTIWPCLTLLLTLALLPRIKGAILALQWTFHVRQ